MKRLLVLVLLFGSLAAAKEPLRKCVIANMHKRNGAEAWTRWSQAKPYNFVEGEFPEGVKYRWEFGDKEVREIQAKNGKVIILKNEYTLAEQQDARAQCKAWTEPEGKP